MLLATIAGLGVALWAFKDTGIDGILSVARRIGPGGFLLYCLYSCGVFVILGAAWLAAAPGEPTTGIARFAWARAVRESVADLLPFSQIGGIVVGARTLTIAGMSPPRVYASLIVDMTTEMASQLIFTTFGIAMAVSILSAGPQAATLWPLLLSGGALMAAITAAFFAAQRYLPRVAAALAQRMLPGAVAAMDALGAELARIYTHRRRVALAFLLNLAAWIASAAGAWIVLRVAGADLPIMTVLTIESLIFTLRSVAFAIPGGIGVQEAAYALAAPMLGLAPDAALALALAKRARDLTIGLPTLLLWQAAEVRACWSRPVVHLPQTSSNNPAAPIPPAVHIDTTT